MAVDGVTTGMSPYTPLELQEMGVAGAIVEPTWAGPGLAPQCTVPNITSWLVRRYHTRHQNHRRYHYHHAPAS